MRALLETLREFGVTYYKYGELELAIGEQPDGAPAQAIGFAAPTDEPAEDPFAKLRGKIDPAYFDPRLGLIARK